VAAIPQFPNCPVSSWTSPEEFVQPQNTSQVQCHLLLVCPCLLHMPAAKMPCCLVHKILLFVIAFDITQKSLSQHASNSMIQMHER